jgi:hypothetical protein
MRRLQRCAKTSCSFGDERLGLEHPGAFRYLPTTAEVMQIVAFEKGIFSAQDWDARARSLIAEGGLGGPVQLSAGTPGLPLPTGPDTFALFGAWQTLPTGADRAGERESLCAVRLIGSHDVTFLLAAVGLDHG